MRWLRQVVHVAAKDARRLRWQALAYAGLVLLAAFEVGRGQLVVLWGLAAMMIAMVAVAQVVQDDPAIRDDAFWVSRPLAPGAVFTAKTLTIVAAVVMAVAGQVVLFARYQIVGPALLRSLGNGLPIWLAVVTSAVVLAAVTRDLRGFAAALVAAVVVWALFGQLLEGRMKGLFTRPEWATPMLMLAGSLAIAGHQYMSGRRLRAVASLTVLLMVSGVLGWAPGPRRAERAAAEPVLPPALRPDSILVRAARVDRPLAGTLSFRVEGGSPGLEYVFAGGTLELRAPDGSVAETKLGHRKLSFGLPALAELPTVRWAGSAGEPGWMAWDVVDQRGGASDDVRRGLLLRLYAPESVSGSVAGWEGRIGARLPLRAGASATRSGRRVIVRTVARDQRLPNVLPPAPGIRVELRVSRIDPSLDRFSNDPGPVHFAILDLPHGVAWPLEVISSDGDGGGLLPGPVTKYTYRLQWAARGSAPPVLSDALELLVLDWRPVGSFPVTLPVVQER